MDERDITLSHLIEGGCYRWNDVGDTLVATKTDDGSWTLSTTMGRFNSKGTPEYQVSDEGRIWREGKLIGHVDSLMIFYILPASAKMRCRRL